jgi:hypothetical protein
VWSYRSSEQSELELTIGGWEAASYLTVAQIYLSAITCPAVPNPVDPIEQTITAGGSGLSYDASTDGYVYAWKTTKNNWAGNCCRFELGFNDDISRTVDEFR